MMHKAWCNVEEVPYNFSRSSIKFQGHRLKNRRLESNLSNITRPVAAIKSLRFALFQWRLLHFDEYFKIAEVCCYWPNWQYVRISSVMAYLNQCADHDDVIKWKHFPRYWPFVRGIHRSPVNSTHKGRWRGALIFSLICVWINGWVNNREAGVWDAIVPIMTSF